MNKEKINLDCELEEIKIELGEEVSLDTLEELTDGRGEEDVK